MAAVTPRAQALKTNFSHQSNMYKPVNSSYLYSCFFTNSISNVWKFGRVRVWIQSLAINARDSCGQGIVKSGLPRMQSLVVYNMIIIFIIIFVFIIIIFIIISRSVHHCMSSSSSLTCLLYLLLI